MPLTYTFKKGSATAVDLKSFPYVWGGSASTYAVHVEKSTGLIGKPSFKSVEQFDWKYLHGTTPDLRNRRYQNKEITLSCWIDADSKQQLTERFNSFMAFFNHDDLIMMKVTWTTDNDNGGATPNPHASKGLFGLIWLGGVDGVQFKWHKGRNIVRFTLKLYDPYPMKRVYYYDGTESDGVEYDIVSDSEIDIFTEDGFSVFDILTGEGTIGCSIKNHILVCGDVVHATDSDGYDNLVVPANQLDTVTITYDEI